MVAYPFLRGFLDLFPETADFFTIFAVSLGSNFKM